MDTKDKQPVRPRAADPQAITVADADAADEPRDASVAAEGALLQQMYDQTKLLAQDVTGLVELRLQKTKIEIEETLDQKANQIAANVIFGVLGALAGLFVLLAAAFALGDLLGHVAWGFLVVGVVLGLVGFLVKKARPDLVDVGSQRARVDEERLAPEGPKGQPAPQARPTDPGS